MHNQTKSTSEVVSDLKNAALHNKFHTVEVKTNKGLIVYLRLSKTLLEQYDLKDTNHNKFYQGPESEHLDPINKPVVMWQHTESKNLCVAQLEGLNPPHAISEDKIIGVVLGMVQGQKHTTDDLAAISTIAEKALTALEQKEQAAKFEAYKQIPELESIMTWAGLTVDDF